MTRNEILTEIERVKTARNETRSQHLRKDYGKYLKKLYKELRTI